MSRDDSGAGCGSFDSKEWKAVIVSAEKAEESKSGKGLTLLKIEPDFFFRGGGGQPGDSGKISWKSGGMSFEAEVAGFEGEAVIVKKSGELKEGLEVSCSVNWERRESLLRAHTGEHILFGRLKELVPSIELDKIMLGEEESSVFFSGDEEDGSGGKNLSKGGCAVSAETVLEAEKRANEMIARNLPVSAHIVPKSEVLKKYPKARIKEEKIDGEEARVVDLGGEDFSACCGLHAKSTGEVGKIIVTAVRSAGSGKTEMRFRVAGRAEEALFSHSRELRMTAWSLGIEPEKVCRTSRNLKDEAEKLRDSVRSLSRGAQGSIEEEKAGNITFCHAVFSGLDRSELMKKADALIKKENRIACLIDGQSGEDFFVVLMSSPSAKHDIQGIFRRAASELGGRGGGRDNVAMGSFPKGAEADRIIDCFRKGLDDGK